MVALLALFISTLILTSNADGNVTCSGTGMDWYTNHVGETACKTYERLRQICNPAFEVGTMSVKSLAPDVCDDQNHDCCCNSIAFALAMLCLNCQRDNANSPSGHDAGVGAYEDYLMGGSTSGFCSPVHNETFSTSVQLALCNEDIKIFDSLYTLFWPNGDWYYVYTTEKISEQIAAQNNNTFTHCAPTVINTTSASLNAMSTSTSSRSGISLSTSNPTLPDDISSGSRLRGGTIIGIVLGTVGGLAVFVLMLWFLWWKRRDMNGPVLPDNQIEPSTTDTREVYNRIGNPYPPEHVTGYDSNMKARDLMLPQLDVQLSQLEKGPQLYSNQSPTISPTTTTTSGLSSTTSAASPSSLEDPE